MGTDTGDRFATPRLAVSAGLLLVVTVCGTAALGGLRARVEAVNREAERFALQRGIADVIVVPRGTDLAAAMRAVHDPAVFVTHKPVYAWVLEYQGILGGVVVRVPVPEGYNGDIVLAVGVQANGRITAVKAVSHRETPGFGDAIDADKSVWLQSFTGHSLADPGSDAWKLRQDGGDFDGISGATMTSSAVIGGIRRALLYVESVRARAPALPAPDG